jgi:hypothetical protein
MMQTRRELEFTETNKKVPAKGINLMRR